MILASTPHSTEYKLFEISSSPVGPPHVPRCDRSPRFNDAKPESVGDIASAIRHLIRLLGCFQT